MEKLIFAVSVAVITLIGSRSASAAEGTLSYEAASSSWNCHVVTVSTVNPTQVIIGTTTATYMAPDGFRRISWYSYTMWNLNTSSAVYKLTQVDDTAPSMSCAVDAPIGIGAATSPVAVTEQAVGMMLWMLSCHKDTNQDFRIGQRGR